MNVDFDFQDELDFFKNDRRKEAKDINAKSIVTKNKRKTIFIKRTETIQKMIPNRFEENDSTHIISNGSFGSNELLTAINNKFNINVLWITTWSINNDFIDSIKKMTLNKLYFLCDKSLKSRKIAYYGRMMEAIKKIDSKVKMIAGLHSKVTIAETEKMGKLIIEASANYSKNVRIEQFVVTRDEALYNFHKDWMKKLL